MIESAAMETPATVGSHYDDLDAYYREVWGPHVHHGLWWRGDESTQEATEALILHMFRDEALNALSRVCDVGCGYGETARWLSRRTAAQVTGFTVSAKQAEYARTQTTDGKGPKIFLQDWLSTKGEVASFDVVFSIESSEHMPDIQAFFDKAARVLKPGGRLLVCAWLSAESPSRLSRKLLLEPICTEGRLRLCTESEYGDFIRRAGCTLDDSEDVTDKVKATWTHCLKRVAKRLVTRRDDWAFLLRHPSRNKSFLASLLRIRIAYETRAMRYVIFRAHLPA